MKQLTPLLALLLGLALLVPLVLLSVDRGPFERTAVGREAPRWEVALDGAAEPGNGDAYEALLALSASDELGALSHARRRQGAILLPLFALLVFLLALPHAGRWAATGAGLLAVVMAPVALGATAIVPAMPATLLILAGIVILDRRRSVPGWCAAGVLVGLGTTGQPTLGWAVFLLLAALAWIRPGRTRRTWAFLVLTLAWVGGGLVGSLATESVFPQVPGVEAYRGHRTVASGVSPRRGDSDEGRWWSYADFRRGAFRAAGGPVDPDVVQLHWWKRALQEGALHPLAELRRAGLHLLTSFQADPLPREVSVSYLLQRTERGGLQALLWVTRLLLPLGLIGLWIGRRWVSAPLLVAAGSGLAAATLTYADPDTRLLTLAGLLVGIGVFARAMAAGPTRRRWVGAALVLPAILIWGIWPARGGVPGMQVQGDDAYFLGTLYDVEKRGSVAQREYDRALRMDPENPYPRLALAVMLARDQLHEQASLELENLVAQHPRFLAGWLLLARTYEMQQRWPEGAAAYESLLQLEPWNPEFLNNYGTLLIQMGLYEQAVAALEAALVADPDYTLARENLEQLRARGLAPPAGADLDPFQAAQEGVLSRLREGNAAAAEDSLLAAYERFGRVSQLEYLEGLLRLAQGRGEEAVAMFLPLQEEMQGDVLFLNNLGSAYALTGNEEQAREIWESALRLQPDNYRIRQNLLRLNAADSLDTAPGR
jgi:Tfp pilus assembly protein PilF